MGDRAAAERVFQGARCWFVCQSWELPAAEGLGPSVFGPHCDLSGPHSPDECLRLVTQKRISPLHTLVGLTFRPTASAAELQPSLPSSAYRTFASLLDGARRGASYTPLTSLPQDAASKSRPTSSGGLVTKVLLGAGAWQVVSQHDPHHSSHISSLSPQAMLDLYTGGKLPEWTPVVGLSDELAAKGNVTVPPCHFVPLGALIALAGTNGVSSAYLTQSQLDNREPTEAPSSAVSKSSATSCKATESQNNSSHGAPSHPVSEEMPHIRRAPSSAACNAAVTAAASTAAPWCAAPQPALPLGFSQAPYGLPSWPLGTDTTGMLGADATGLLASGINNDLVQVAQQAAARAAAAATASQAHLAALVEEAATRAALDALSLALATADAQQQQQQQQDALLLATAPGFTSAGSVTLPHAQHRRTSSVSSTGGPNSSSQLSIAGSCDLSLQLTQQHIGQGISSGGGAQSWRTSLFKLFLNSYSSRSARDAHWWLLHDGKTVEGPLDAEHMIATYISHMARKAHGDLVVCGTEAPEKPPLFAFTPVKALLKSISAGQPYELLPSTRTAKLPPRADQDVMSALDWLAEDACRPPATLRTNSATACGSPLFAAQAPANAALPSASALLLHRLASASPGGACSSPGSPLQSMHQQQHTARSSSESGQSPIAPASRFGGPNGRRPNSQQQGAYQHPRSSLGPNGSSSSHGGGAPNVTRPPPLMPPIGPKHHANLAAAMTGPGSPSSARHQLQLGSAGPSSWGPDALPQSGGNTPKWGAVHAERPARSGLSLSSSWQQAPWLNKDGGLFADVSAMHAATLTAEPQQHEASLPLKELLLPLCDVLGWGDDEVTDNEGREGGRSSRGESHDGEDGGRRGSSSTGESTCTGCSSIGSPVSSSVPDSVASDCAGALHSGDLFTGCGVSNRHHGKASSALLA